MELPIWYRFLINPFSCHVLKFKLHWYKIVIRVTKNVSGAGFLEHPVLISFKAIVNVEIKHLFSLSLIVYCILYSNILSLFNMDVE